MEGETNILVEEAFRVEFEKRVVVCEDVENLNLMQCMCFQTQW